MKKVKNRKWWFKGLKGFLKIFIRRKKYIFLGEGFDEEPAIILSNHVGAIGPLSHELYFPEPFRFWGTYEMNSGIKSVYKYLTEVYYTKKKHWKPFPAKLFCLLAAPLANLFYKGLNLISTYPDYRFRKTLIESLKTVKEGQSLIIFPEDSENGYYDEMTKFYAGFVTFAQATLKRGMDLKIYKMYLRKKEKIVVVDKPIRFSELMGQFDSKQALADAVCERVNELGTMDIQKGEK